MPTSRLVEEYLYGQIHFDSLDEKDKDRFATSREGVISDDEKFDNFLKKFREKVIPPIWNQWDKWRWANREDGDPENTQNKPLKKEGRENYIMPFPRNSFPR
jgi:hypothetical protein